MVFFGLYSVTVLTSKEQLQYILDCTSTGSRCAPGFQGSLQGFDRPSLAVDCDEVYQSLLVGDARTAQNKDYLVRIGVTHILNAAEGSFEGMVNTGVGFYLNSGISYMGLPILDVPTFRICDYFEVASQFIDNAVKSGGKVLGHCVRGRSRSSTISLAYLVLKIGIPAPMALRMVRQARAILPNTGFLQQLADLDNRQRNMPM